MKVRDVEIGQHIYIEGLEYIRIQMTSEPFAYDTWSSVSGDEIISTLMAGEKEMFLFLRVQDNLLVVRNVKCPCSLQPPVRCMTKKEIGEALGYPIKIVKE